MPAANAG